jgi:glycogen operon protein
MLASVLFAHGTPMLLSGDEFGRTQRGNNNAYCQDDETSWLDWSMADKKEGRELRDFVIKLITLRQEHAALRSRHFLHGQSELAPGIFDIAWFEAGGESITEDSWKNRDTRLLSLRRAMPNDDGTVSLLTLLLHPFALPAPTLPGRILLNTAQPETGDVDVKDQKVTVRSRSAVLVYSRLERAPQ